MLRFRLRLAGSVFVGVMSRLPVSGGARLLGALRGRHR
jgi:hypothetical protein